MRRQGVGAAPRAVEQQHAPAGAREDIADLSARLDVAEVAARRLPHREKYLMMGRRLSRRLLATHLEWLDEIERELES